MTVARLALALVAVAPCAVAQDAPRPAAMVSVPRLTTLPNSTSELVSIVQRFNLDQQALNRRYDADDSPAKRKRMREFYDEWRVRLREHDFDRLSQEGRVDYVLLDNYLIHELALLDRDAKQRTESAPLLPFADRLLGLQDSRRNLETINSPALARTLADVAKQVDSLRALFEAAARGSGAAADSAARPRGTAPRVSRTVANRSAEEIDALRRVMTGWYRFYDGYDPVFTWWTRDPYRKLDSALVRYARTLRERVVGIRPQDLANNQGPIVGDPIGADGLKEDLRFEMIPYTAEELIAIA